MPGPLDGLNAGGALSEGEGAAATGTRYNPVRPGPASTHSLTAYRRIELMLGVETASGFHDPAVIAGRRAELSHAALKAGELFVELLVRLRDVHMGPGGCVTKAASALFSLHNAAQEYREVRLDDMPREEGVIAQAIHGQHGPRNNRHRD